MKSYTDLEQSKKLAEILPFESADIFHFIHGVNTPCWSLTALRNLLPAAIKINKKHLFI